VNLEKIKKVVKRILPGRITRFLTGIFYGWHGNYNSWEEAKKSSAGYNSGLIFEKVIASASKVRDGKAVYERDSVLYDEIHYSFPVLSGLLWVAAQNNGRLNVLDFGGAFGSRYYQNKKFLDPIREVHWFIVEQPEFVKNGLQNFSTDRLSFFYTIDDCLKNHNIDIILLSSVLQYLSEPYNLLENIISKNIKYIIVDRTPFIEGNDRITIQKVPKTIYEASYPCWFFNKAKFVSYLSQKYELILEFDALDKANILSEFKGFLFRKIIDE
jgi:putative methyltransferase (TIGR04325 family)